VSENGHVDLSLGGVEGEPFTILVGATKYSLPRDTSMAQIVVAGRALTLLGDAAQGKSEATEEDLERAEEQVWSVATKVMRKASPAVVNVRDVFTINDAVALVNFLAVKFGEAQNSTAS
jgi:hypothetical protein